MSTLWIIAIILILLFIWLLMQPKQGTKASNASRRQTPPDALPSGDEQDKNLDVTKAMSQNKAALPTPSPLLDAEIRQLIDSGQKIAAIKRVRDFHHWGLKEAKEYVETLERYGSPPMMATPQRTAEPTPALRQEAKRLLASHQKVAAVKLVRDHTHWSLQKAKQYVDDLQQEEF